MKTVYADLLDDVVGSYDQTKTTVQGRAQTRTISGDTVIGPPLNKFLDVFTDAAITPVAGGMFLSPNGRLFIIGTHVAGVAPIALYNFNLTTGTSSYVGKIAITIPNIAATTHTFRGIKVIDTGTTGWKIFLTTTGSVLINGGTFLANDVDLADFVPIGFPTLPFATGNNQNAVYFLQDPSNTGVGQLQTASAGSSLDVAGNRLYVHNGVSATHQFYLYDTSIAPTYTTAAVTGVSATDIISDAGHPYVDNDPITFTSITGGAGLTAGTTYFVRSSIAGVSYQVSATSGGAVINFTTDISAGTVGRAFGTTGSNFIHKTGNLTALTGTLLLTDSEKFCVPGHTANSGQNCIFVPTSTNLYFGQVADLTSGAVTWPSLVTSNILGGANEITAPTTTLAGYLTSIDRAYYTTNTNLFVIKQLINNDIDLIFGGNNNEYLETLGLDAIPFQTISVVATESESGFLAMGLNTAGQRGIVITDVRSHESFDYSYIVTKVLNTPNATYNLLSCLEKMKELTGEISIYYRTSGFGSISGGWAAIDFADDISGFASGAQVQFKILFNSLNVGSCVPAQLTDLVLAYSSLNEISENFEYTHDDSDPGNPSRVAFRLKTAYISTVPTLYFRAYDISSSLIASHNTSANPSYFEYSTDSGSNWLALGTIPNTVGTLVRYEFSTPPGVDVRPSIRES